jgi:hypothetical protein
MSLIVSCPSYIVEVLLFEADFFVDEKDLQTLIGATSHSRFFFERSLVYRPCAARPAGSNPVSGATLQSSIT